MITNEQWITLRPLFPFLEKAHPDLVRELLHRGQILEAPRGAFIFTEGEQCSALSLVLSGEIRVFKQGDSGREITLYRLGPGDSCILTASCILNGEGYPALAVVERPTRALTLPAPCVRDWLTKYASWQTYLFRMISRRLESIITVVEEVTFRRMDQRLADYLCRRAQASPDGILSQTHQEIADELGTAREVVTRLLKDFQENNLVRLGRGMIQVLDPAGLQEKGIV